MSTSIENLINAQQRAMAGRPKVGGFPLPGSDTIGGWNHPKHLGTSLMPESIPHQPRARRFSRNTLTHRPG